MTTPATTQVLHTVAGAICHRLSSSLLGSPPGWTVHQVPLQQSAHSPRMDQQVLQAPWHNGTTEDVILYCSQKQLYSLPGAPSRQTELHCGCAFLQSNVPFLFPCPPGQPAVHAYTSRAGRALEGRFKYLLHRAMAHSTSTTYRAGIRKYYAFCTKFNLDTPPRVQVCHKSLCCLSQPSTLG